MLDRSSGGFGPRWTWADEDRMVRVQATSEPVHLGPGDQTYFGSDDRDVRDRIYGQGGDDFIHGQKGNDRLFGGGGDDLLLGDAGSDRLYGGGGDDELRGGKGHNTLFGGLGSDFIEVHDGTDTVAYDSVVESVPGNTHDTISLFATGEDHIDLQAVHAITGTDRNDRFTWIDDEAFSGSAGELRYDPATQLPGRRHRRRRRRLRGLLPWHRKQRGEDRHHPLKSPMPLISPS